MSSDARFRALSLIAFTSLVAAGLAGRVESQVPQQTPPSAADSQAQAQLSRLFAGILSDTSVHMRMGPTRAATAADSARAADVVVRARAALRQYVDVKLAERDGYYRNMPWMEEQPIYHYNRAPNFKAADHGTFDIAKPVSLLYQKDDRGQLKLIGAMYAAGASATPEDLDALLPTSMAHWHEHVNLCYPGPSVTRYLAHPRKIDGALVFMMQLFFGITSERACESAGGQFVALDGGGWMTHVYMFADSDDPKVIWDSDDIGSMNGPVRHPPMDARR
jgi:hypothetical protein